MARRLSSRRFLWLACVLSRQFPTVQSCSPSRLHQAATAFGITALLLVLAGGHNHWPSCPLPSIVPLFFSCYRLDDSVVEIVRCLVHTNSLRDSPAETGDEPQRNEFLAAHPSDPSKGDGGSLYSRLCADAWRLPCLSLSGIWSSPSDARAVCLVRCDSSEFMSLCIGLLARAGALIALLCNSCMVSRLLVMRDVESALSLLVEAVILLDCACGVRACSDVSCIIFS